MSSHMTLLIANEDLPWQITFKQVNNTKIKKNGIWGQKGNI